MRMRLLLVEDHAVVREMVAEFLVDAGFVVDACGSAAEARDALSVRRYDVMLVDLSLPDGCGLAFLREVVSKTGGALPVLVVSARSAWEDRVTALDSGADDYIAKPFEPAELQARLRAVLRRPGVRTPLILQAGTLAFDPVTRQLTIAGQPAKLGRREADLLERLLRASGQILVRPSLEDGLFAEAVTPNALEAVISRLRRRIADASGVQLETVRGVGYRLSTQVLSRDAEFVAAQF